MASVVVVVVGGGGGSIVSDIHECREAIVMMVENEHGTFSIPLCSDCDCDQCTTGP